MARRLGALAGALTLATVSGLGGCASEPQSFATPDAAVESLVGALRTNDMASLDRILGPDADEALSSGDDVDDVNRQMDFVRLYDERHRLTGDEADVKTLEVGPTEWPMPIPIVKGEKGWYFDTDAGLDEMLSRRIGRNELDAIQTSLAIADAEREYAAADFNGDGWREYAQQFASDPGRKNGLFWHAAPGEPPSPLGELVVDAAAEGYRKTSDHPQPYHGYYFRILTAQGDAAPGGAMSYVAEGRMIGGFAVIAWPAEYGNSGLKSFVVSHHGVVYQKDLGDNTDSIARAMKEFNPDSGWEKCGQLD